MMEVIGGDRQTKIKKIIFIRYVLTRQNTVNKCKDAKKVPHGKEGTLNQYINKYQRIEAEFNSFMYQAIRRCARNATRKVTAAEINNGIPLESLDEKYIREYMAVEDEHQIEDSIIVEADFKIRLNDDFIRKLLAGLTEREIQALILHEAFDYDYSQIGRMLGISPDRAKAYKCHGLKKAKVRAKNYAEKK